MPVVSRGSMGSDWAGMKSCGGEHGQNSRISISVSFPKVQLDVMNGNRFLNSVGNRWRLGGLLSSDSHVSYGGPKIGR